MTGFQDFLFGEDQLIYYDYIRRCISKEQDIVLSLVEKAIIVAQYPQVLRAAIDRSMLGGALKSVVHSPHV